MTRIYNSENWLSVVLKSLLYQQSASIVFAIFKEALIIQITLEKINKGHYSFLSCSVILLWIIVYDPDSLRSSNFDEVQSLIFSSVIFMIFTRSKEYRPFLKPFLRPSPRQ